MLLMASLIASVVFVSIFVAPVFAGDEIKTTTQQDKTLKFLDVWARKTMSSDGNSAVYMRISNPTDQQLVIVEASAPSIADSVELHESFVDEQGISRMTSVDKIVIPANSEIELKPGGIHVMLLDLKKSLEVGDKFTLYIKFDNMDSAAFEVEVR
jgi:hypothetical protein